MKMPITRVSVWDLAGFLVGHRSSIWRLIHSPYGIGLGAALVATAAMAREYDAVSLWDQPADLLAPFVASILLASGLFGWVLATARAMRIEVRHPGRAYVVFLTGYWLTAPLAWLYAIPIEELADEITSMRFNLTLLSIVSIWRVLLFARVISIQFRIRYFVSLASLLVPCMAVAFVGVFSAMLDLVGVMGGVRLTQTQEIMKDFQDGVLGMISMAFVPVVILAVVAIIMGRREKSQNRSTPTSGSLSWALWGVPMVASIGFGVAMMFFQPSLIRAARIDRLLQSDRIDEAIELMSEGTEKDLPPAWDPPPRATDRYEATPSLSELLNSIEATSPPTWIARRLLARADLIAPIQCGIHRGFLIADTGKPRRVFGTVEALQDLVDVVDRMLAIEAIDADSRGGLLELKASATFSLDSARKEQREREQADDQPETIDQR